MNPRDIRDPIQEAAITLVSEGSRIEGKAVFESIAKIFGTLKGEVVGMPGSTLILCESGVVEGRIEAEDLIIDGFVRGEISATSKVQITSTGRVVGDIRSPSLQIDTGGYFEGSCAMDSSVAPGPSAPAAPARKRGQSSGSIADPRPEPA